MENTDFPTCRTCMETPESLHNLQESNSTGLLELLHGILGFEVKLSHGEFNICNTCEGTLRQVEKFKKTCLESHEKFCETQCKEERLDRDIRHFLEHALSSEIDEFDPVLATNESDSDFCVGAPKKRKKRVKRVPKPRENGKKCAKTTGVVTRRTKKLNISKYSAEEVQKAIEECTSYFTDDKFKACVICGFKSLDSFDLTTHMQCEHEQSLTNWCSDCNLLNEDLVLHKETSKCGKYLCTFCKNNYEIFSILEHLGTHYNESLDKPDPEIKSDLNQHNTDEIGNNAAIKSEPISLTNLIKEENNLNHDLKDEDNPDDDQEQSIPSDNSDTEYHPVPTSKRPYTRRSTVAKHITKRPSRKLKHCTTNDADPNLKDKADSTGSISNAAQRIKVRMKCRLEQFDHEEVLQAINDTRKPFQTNRECIICGFVASHARALSVHMTLLHKELKDNWCSRCNAIVDNLNQHAEGHKNDLLKCTFCGRSFNKFFHLKEHLKSHSRLHAYDTESKWFSCDICPNSYPDEKQLNEHDCKGPDPTFNGKKKKIKNARFCVPCNKRVRSLPIHIKHKHNEDGESLKEPSNKLCSICGKTFSDNSKLTVHMRIHTGESPYKCSYCDKRCGTRNHLVVHERTHTGEKPHICYICGKAFAQSSVLGTHMKIHTGRPEQCSVCDQRFCRPAELKLHMRRHTGEKPYLCSNCGLSFHQRSHLVEHIKRHSNERPYKCSFCEKGFKQISVLKAHENIHTGLKPYKCSQCSYSCRQPYSLTVHMKQHTTDAPQPERPHKCLVCLKQFTTHAMLMSHTNNRHGEIVEDEKDMMRIETVMDCS